jgi:hypothetical protein
MKAATAALATPNATEHIIREITALLPPATIRQAESVAA